MNIVKEDIEKILNGDQLAGAKLIRMLEDGDPAGVKVLKALFPHTGKAYILGITGLPGSGKSTLVNQLVAELRSNDLKVGVVAIDPSSPLSGGAFLGDRLRMRQHSEDAGVFIRSMATRGHMGGLSRTTRETVLVLDAMGYDVLIIETVGVGQDEVEIAELAHTTAVVCVPGMGDEIQTLKAGLMEIGDVFVVNKSDRPGADDEVGRLERLLDMGPVAADGWFSPICKTIAAKGEGISELIDIFWRHRRFLIDGGKFSAHNLEQTVRFFQRTVMEMAAEKIFKNAEDSPAYRALMEDLNKRKIDPVTAAEKLVKGLRCKI